MGITQRGGGITSFTFRVQVCLRAESAPASSTLEFPRICLPSYCLLYTLVVGDEKAKRERGNAVVKKTTERTLTNQQMKRNEIKYIQKGKGGGREGEISDNIRPEWIVSFVFRIYKQSAASCRRPLRMCPPLLFDSLPISPLSCV